MEEQYTYEAVLNRMLNTIPRDIDKREGSVIYNALAPAAAELAQAYINLYSVEDRTYADTCTGEDLTRRTSERGIVRHPATRAVKKGIFNIDIPLNSRFRGGDLNYRAIEKLNAGQFKMECETEGEAGNVYSGILIPIEYIDGLESATLSDILIPGEDAEADDSLRERYFNSLQGESFGGNISDYKIKTNELNGVGGTKVYPVWNGGGTVKLVIIDSDYNKPSEELINNIQASIDPADNQGNGVGIAPIGHTVTVEAAGEKIISIKSNIILQSGYTWQDVQPNITETINNYFNSLNRTWQNSSNLVVRISQIESRILTITGVLDIQNTLINSSATNLMLGENEIAVLGEVVKV